MSAPKRSAALSQVAVGEAVILLTPPLDPYGNAYCSERRVQSNDSLAAGAFPPRAEPLDGAVQPQQDRRGVPRGESGWAGWLRCVPQRFQSRHADPPGPLQGDLYKEFIARGLRVMIYSGDVSAGPKR